MSRWLVLCLVISSLGLFSCSEREQTQAPPTITVIQPAISEYQLAIIEEVDSVIRERYIFADYGGYDWEGAVDELNRQINGGMSQDQFSVALNGLVSGLPEGTAFYITREERITSELGNIPVYTGIGAFVSIRGEPVPRMILLSVMEASPAQSAGLDSHDAVYVIDDEPVRAEEGLSVVERVRGPEGTEVKLEVASPGESKREVLITRERVIASDKVYSTQLASGVSYILAPVMADKTLSDAILEVLQAMEQQSQVSGLILDLRIAHTSADWPLEPMLRLFSDGQHGMFYDRSQLTPLEVEGADLFGSQSIPLVILIGPDTIGPSEIFAGSLQALGRATLVGLPTPGQLLGFESYRLSDGSQLSYAISSFLIAKGHDLAMYGLSPDVQMEHDWDQVSMLSDPVIEFAEQKLLTVEDLDE
jgi:carboxyl-terminal processing protease